MPKNPSEKSRVDWIVFFGEDWGEHPSTGQFLALEMQHRFKILWIDSLGLREPEVNSHDILRILRKLKNAVLTRGSNERMLTKRQTNIYPATPLTIPFWRFAVVRWWNRFYLKRFIKKQYARHGIVNPLVITTCVASSQVIKDISDNCLVYYCADEYSLISGLDPDLVVRLEKQLLSCVDMVFAVSRALVKSKSAYHPVVKYLPHGVDVELFSRALTRNVSRPADLPDDYRKIIGFVGLLGEHIDYSVIEHLARKFDDCAIVLIGNYESGVPLPKRENVFYLGARKRNVLPEYLAFFDVCINPYLVNKRNKYANPTKLKEYLAAGRMVVMTPHDEVEEVPGRIEFATTPSEFETKIQNLFGVDRDSVKKEISSTMNQHSWGVRANWMIHEIYRCHKNG